MLKKTVYLFLRDVWYLARRQCSTFAEWRKRARGGQLRRQSSSWWCSQKSSFRWWRTATGFKEQATNEVQPKNDLQAVLIIRLTWWASYKIAESSSSTLVISLENRLAILPSRYSTVLEFHGQEEARTNQLTNRVQVEETHGRVHHSLQHFLVEQVGIIGAHRKVVQRLDDAAYNGRSHENLKLRENKLRLIWSRYLQNWSQLLLLGHLQRSNWQAIHWNLFGYWKCCWFGCWL